MPLKIVRNDITRIEADAIVCCGNGGLTEQDGVCGQVFRAAGPELRIHCSWLDGCAPGEAVVTPGFQLPAKHIIHTVGPRWRGGFSGEEHTLRLCYRSTLKAAAELGCKSVAIPLIASGHYGYPKAEAMRIASEEIQSFLESHEDMYVELALFGEDAYREGQRLFPQVQAYIDANYVDARLDRRRRGAAALPNWADDSLLDAQYTALRSITEQETEDEQELAERLRAIDIEMRAFPSISPYGTQSLDELLARRDVPFKEMLRRLINSSGMTDAEVYRRANITRQTFNSIWNRSNYSPTKRTVLAIAVSLRLNLDQTRDLLNTLGLSLSRSSRMDIIVEYYIQSGQYNIFEINETLFSYGEDQLGTNDMSTAD